MNERFDKARRNLYPFHVPVNKIILLTSDVHAVVFEFEDGKKLTLKPGVVTGKVERE